MFPITIPQKNIWNLQKFYPGSSISNISGMLVFDRMLDLGLLAEAVNAFINARGSNHRSAEVPANIFDGSFRVAFVEFGINIEAMRVFL